MEVILLERVEKLGSIGDVVKVKNGFARNFLLPQHKALLATDANKARFERERAAIEARNAKARAAAEAEGTSIDGTTYVLIRQAGETGQLYGSVAARDIADGRLRSRPQDRAQARRPQPADQDDRRARGHDPAAPGSLAEDHASTSPARPTKPSARQKARTSSPRCRLPTRRRPAKRRRRSPTPLRLPPQSVAPSKADPYSKSNSEKGSRRAPLFVLAILGEGEPGAHSKKPRKQGCPQ